MMTVDITTDIIMQLTDEEKANLSAEAREWFGWIATHNSGNLYSGKRLNLNDSPTFWCNFRK